MTIPEQKDEERSPELTALLSRLHREKAPWYFEARLKQQLAEARRPKDTFILRPAFTIPIAGAAAAVVLYLSLPSSENGIPGMPDPVDSVGGQVDGSVEVQTSPESPKIPLETDQNLTLPSDSPTQRGPAAPPLDPYLPATISLERNNNQAIPSASPLLIPADTSSDSVLRYTIVADSADTLQKPPDSLKEED